MKAVIYARYSSGRQHEESIERQLEICTKYAEENNLLLVGSYIDRRKTGKNDNRPDFQRMIYDSSRRQFDVVLVWRFDRFARNMDDHAAYERILKQNGVKLVSATEPIPEGAHASIIKGVIIGGNESYSIELAAKVKDGMKKAAQKGQTLGGGRVLGYRSVDKHLVVDEGEAQIVRMIFERFYMGKSLSEIASELNSKGLKNSKENPFSITGVQRILSNKRYIGIQLYKGEDIGIRIPSIVQQDIFDAVQIQLKKNKRAPSRNREPEEQYLLTTKLFCGKCKAPMSGVSGTSKSGDKHQYYACMTRYKKQRCEKNYIKKEIAEKAVVDVVKKTLLHSNIQMLAHEVVRCCVEAQDNGELLRLQGELKEVKRSINNLVDMIEAGRTTEAIADRLDAREAQRKELEAAIAREKILHRIPTEDEVVFFFDNFLHGEIDSPEYNRYLIDILVNSVYLYDTAEKSKQKMTVLLNVQNGLETVEIDDIMECSSFSHMVSHRGFEPRTP